MKTNYLLLVMQFITVMTYAQANYQMIGTAPAPGNNNTLVGASSAASPPENWTGGFTGTYNSGFGYRAIRKNQSGNENTAVGAAALDSNLTGNSNTAVGRSALLENQYGSTNVGVGLSALRYSIGSNNVALGSDTANGLRGGDANLFLGNAAGPAENLTFSNRLYVNNKRSSTPLIYGEFDNKNLNFYVNESDASRTIITSFTNFGNLYGNSGLRFTNLNYAHRALPSNGKVLSLDAEGDVIMVLDDKGISASCATQFRVPVWGASDLGCSQIYDNGSSVSVGYTVQPSFTYNHTGGSPSFLGGTVPVTGTVKFDVNGVIRTVGIFATSDKKFKKDIKPIESALGIVQNLEGKIYKWNRESYKNMDFDEALHSGFLAQDLEKVLPQLVATNDAGEKSINYLEVIPYLVEAIKEQQSQIEELKTQLSDNFQKQNHELIALENTKIISVSPNPSNDVISVSLNIEKSVTTAKLVVYDLKGAVLSSLNINDRANNITKTLQKDNFGKGVYIVSLVVNGKSIDSKKIIFN